MREISLSTQVSILILLTTSNSKIGIPSLIQIITAKVENYLSTYKSVQLYCMGYLVILSC